MSYKRYSLNKYRAASVLFSLSFLALLTIFYSNYCCFGPDSGQDFPYDPKFAFTLLGASAAAYKDDPSPLVGEIFGENPEILITARGSCLSTNCSKKLCINASCSCFGYAALFKNSDILVAFRGTSGVSELIKEIRDTMRFRKKMPFGGKVHEFFYKCYSQLYPKLSPLAKSGSKNIYVTGHSLGAALASLFASQLSFEVGEIETFQRRYSYRLIDSSNATVSPDIASIKGRLKSITFGQPRVGDSAYATVYDRLVPQTWRVVHHKDIVPHVPPCNLLAERQCKNGSMYYHTGTEVFYGENMTVTTPLYSVCRGPPKNEDPNCSDGLNLVRECYEVKPCIDDHLVYFGMDVSKWEPGNL